MSEYSMQQMDQGFTTLTRTVKEGFKKLYELIANLNFPDLFRVQNEVIAEGFHDQITATIMTHLLDKTAKVSAAEVMFKVHKKRLEKRKQRYDLHLQKIMKRTLESISKEKSATERQIRQLDEPVLNLIEDYAEDKIHSDYSVMAQPAMDYTRHHNRMNQAVRSHILNTQVERAIGKIQEYCNSRKTYESKLQETLVQDSELEKMAGIIPEGRLHLPILCVDDTVFATPECDRSDGAYFPVRSKSTSWARVLNIQEKKNRIMSEMRPAGNGTIRKRLMKAVDDALEKSSLADSERDQISRGIARSIESGKVVISVPCGRSES